MTQLSGLDTLSRNYWPRQFATLSMLLIGVFFTIRAATTHVQANASAEKAPLTKNIEEIEPGDLVVARDEHGTEIGLKPVVEVYRRTSNHLRHLTFRDNAGRTQTLSTTEKHPFWSVTANQFIDAGHLPLGHQVTSPSGDLQTLIHTRYEPHPSGITVYNFQVEDYHTYYVQSHSQRGPPVLVHNHCRHHIDGGIATPDQALDGATDYLGPNYRDMGNGRYLSADGLRQVRLGSHELRDPNNLHIHFEHYDTPWDAGGSIIESAFTHIQ